MDTLLLIWLLMGPPANAAPTRLVAAKTPPIGASHRQVLYVRVLVVTCAPCLRFVQISHVAPPACSKAFEFFLLYASSLALKVQQGLNATQRGRSDGVQR